MIGEAAVLEMMAEEATELAHAALKMARILRKENPTPVKQGEALSNLLEELADLENAKSEWIYGQNFPSGMINVIGDIRKRKLKRWEERLGYRND